ncbi:hypothetical protein B0H11DRAFT_2225112 [Mycena galericulata]|nr:hypothetical protein B0H11DRAFT_2225112 [Mycena galericulata]
MFHKRNPSASSINETPSKRGRTAAQVTTATTDDRTAAQVTTATTDDRPAANATTANTEETTAAEATTATTEESNSHTPDAVTGNDSAPPGVGSDATLEMSGNTQDAPTIQVDVQARPSLDAEIGHNVLAVQSEGNKREAGNVSGGGTSLQDGAIDATTKANNGLVDEASAGTVEVSPIKAAIAVKLLDQLGVEPGAVAGLDSLTLVSIVDRLTAIPAETAVFSDTAANAPAEGATVTHTSNVGALGGIDTRKEDTPVIAALLALQVEDNRLIGWEPNELKRLAGLLTWKNKERETYNITDIPFEVDWGPRSTFKDMSRTLCRIGTSTPVVTWLPGEVANQWFFDSDGYPATRIAFSILPMADNVHEFCKTQLNELCMPTSSSTVAESFGPGEVKVSRWMNERASKGQPARTHEFKAVYDARKTLRDKSLLQQLNVGHLKIHDFVVLELHIGRYPAKDDAPPANAKGKRRAMERWQAFYELQAIYKIKNAIEQPTVADPVADFEI